MSHLPAIATCSGTNSSAVDTISVFPRIFDGDEFSFTFNTEIKLKYWYQIRSIL